MEKDKIITFRVSLEVAEKVKITADEMKISVGEFLKQQIDAFYNPPQGEPEIKYVKIDSEGTVKGHTVELSDALYEELNKLKYNPDTSLDAFVGDICWNRIHWSQKKRSSPTTQINGTSQNTTYETSQARVLYWKKQISETESWDEAGQEQVREGIMSDTLLLEKDRNQLTGKRK